MEGPSPEQAGDPIVNGELLSEMPNVRTSSPPLATKLSYPAMSSVVFVSRYSTCECRIGIAILGTRALLGLASYRANRPSGFGTPKTSAASLAQRNRN